MEVIIGRKGQEHVDSRLNIKIGPKEKVWGQPGSVSQTVSGQHCSVEPQGDQYLIKNLNPMNYTWVNGEPIMARLVNENDVIELGAARYPLSWEVIYAAIPANNLTVDILPLRQIWETYNRETIKMQVSERRFNALRGIIPVITMGTMVGIHFLNIPQGFTIAGYAVAGILALFFFVKSFTDATKLNKKREKLKSWFKQYYRCPNRRCGKFLGFNEFDLLAEQDACPKCKVKYRIGNNR